VIVNKDKNLTQKAWLNTVTHLLYYGLSVLAGLVINPVLLSALGASLLGVWKICRRLLSYVSAADGRISQALKCIIANTQSSTDYNIKRRYVGSAVVVWFIFLPILLTSGGIVAWISPKFVNGLASQYYKIVRLTCLILVFNLIINALNNIADSVLTGENLGYKCLPVRILNVCLSTGLMIYASYKGWSIIGLAVALIISSLITGIALLILAKNTIFWLGINKPQKQDIREFFNLNIWFLAWTLVIKLALSSDVIILGYVISAEKVTSYALSWYPMEMVIGLSLMYIQSVIPGLGEIVGTHNYEKAKKIRKEVFVLSWVMLVVIGTQILLWNPSFISLWVGKKMFIGYTTNILMVIAMIQIVFIRNDACIIDITLNIKRKVLLGACSSIIGVILAYYFSKYWLLGASGLIAGLMIGRSILTISYPLIINKLFKSPSIIYWGDILRQSFVMCSLFIISIYLGIKIQVDSWPLLVIYTASSLIITLSIAFYIGLSKKQRLDIYSRIAQLHIFKQINYA